MIEEEGVILEIKDGTAIVRAQRTTNCDKCATKAVCHGVSETDMLVEALNPVNAKVGDRVYISIGAGTVIKAGALIYLFPLIAFIFGAVVAQAWSERVVPHWNKDFVSAGAGFIFLVLTYAALSFYGNTAKTKKSYMPVILRVV